METKERLVRRWSIFWPLVLIGAGLLLFLNAIGTIPGSSWDIVYRFWPAIFIVSGLDGIFRRQAVVFSTFEFGIALAYQLSLLGIISGIDWYLAICFWPLLLIAVAMDLIIGHRNIWSSLIGLGLGLLLLAGFGLAVTRLAHIEPLNTQVINQTLDGAKRANITISPSLGRLIVTGGAEKNNLINSRLSLVRNDRLDQSYQIQDGTGNFSIMTNGSYSVVYPNLSSTDPNMQTWTCRLNSSIPIDLHLNLGVGEISANLPEIQLTNLDAKLGVGQVLLTLPAGGTYHVSVNNGVGSTLVIVPKGNPIRVHIETGLAASHLPTDFSRQGDNAYSPGAEKANSGIDLSLKQDIGSLEVRYQP